MLAISAHCHAGQIQLAPEGLPLNAKVVVVFLPDDAAGEPALNEARHAALALQSRSAFAQSVLSNPAEDCWNDV